MRPLLAPTGGFAVCPLGIGWRKRSTLPSSVRTAWGRLSYGQQKASCGEIWVLRRGILQGAMCKLGIVLQSASPSCVIFGDARAVVAALMAKVVQT